MIQQLKKLCKSAALGAIAFYRYGISPYLPRRCRYEPTCSAYAAESIKRFGAMKGGALALKRIGRCHPFSKHGFYDPVPDNSPAKSD